VEEAKNIKIHLTRSASAVDLKLSHAPKNELQVTIEILRSSNQRANRQVEFGPGTLPVSGLPGR
jgi:hypothetical protein